MIPASVQSLLGLCQRAGKIASGETAAELALKKRKANLLILAEDASAKTQDHFIGMAQRSGVTCYRVGTREELGSAIGKAFRASIVIQSRDFAKGIESVLAKAGLTPVAGRGCADGAQTPRI